MGTDEGYRLRLDRFGVWDKENEELGNINWVNVVLFLSILSVYLFFENSPLYVISQ